MGQSLIVQGQTNMLYCFGWGGPFPSLQMNVLCTALPQEATVVPTVMQGLQAVCKERPENPVEFLAYYLLSNNPQGSKMPPGSAPGAQ